MSTVSVVILTMGDRAADLATSVESARAQIGVAVEVVLVINGGNPDRSIADVVIDPAENLGIPEGRNMGAGAASGEYLCFLDDDGELLGQTLLLDAVTTMQHHPKTAAVAMAIVDEHGGTARRHRPGLGRTTATRQLVTSFPGGAAVIRHVAFDEAGGLCGPFFYGLEETDLAWRLIARGGEIRYEPGLQMRHPRTTPTRHPSFHRTTARNRVWLAHRQLPLVIAVLYILDWTAVTVLRNFLRPRAVLAHVAGTMDGLRDRVGPRQPMSWATVVRLTRLGRPPVI